jgi:uncharacterized protein (TIGR02246 family)
MRVTKPEDMSRAFATLVEAGDLEALLTLYDVNVKYVSRSGQIVEGTSGIRNAFQWVLAFKGKFHIENKYCVTNGDTALVHAAWSMNGTGAEGRRVDAQGNSTEVLRRQADGTWRYLIDHPFGAEA